MSYKEVKDTSIGDCWKVVRTKEKEIVAGRVSGTWRGEGEGKYNSSLSLVQQEQKVFIDMDHKLIT